MLSKAGMRKKIQIVASVESKDLTQEQKEIWAKKVGHAVVALKWRKNRVQTKAIFGWKAPTVYPQSKAAAD